MKIGETWDTSKLLKDKMNVDLNQEWLQECLHENNNIILLKYLKYKKI